MRMSDWSSDVCSSGLLAVAALIMFPATMSTFETGISQRLDRFGERLAEHGWFGFPKVEITQLDRGSGQVAQIVVGKGFDFLSLPRVAATVERQDRKSTRLNSSH